MAQNRATTHVGPAGPGVALDPLLVFKFCCPNYWPECLL